MIILNKVPSATEVTKLTDAKDIFFDMDGTLIDTELHHAKALRKTLDHFNVERDASSEDLKKRFQGVADDKVFEFYKKELNTSVQKFLEIKNQKVIDIIDSEKEIITKEIRKLLQSLKLMGLRISLITASERKVTEFILQKERVKELFDLVLTREDSTETKPSPRPYLDALNFYKITTKEAFIFEDSPTGLEAARASEIPFAKVTWFSNRA
ncbi:hypothetical protein BIY24_11540 [Halobacteriovorax marinus]|uniref:HAD family hydrolase n=1 Tax=Halobacteriovorax marinus TaxID=97084 RepID=UPI000BC35189|nr:HAD family phosphatase [Halobacteriovorax marinus]ATH08559.1 hypothetical protein BIY24_11540 [Halobacteriovorax marinus]